jgi:hypothetical protein
VNSEAAESSLIFDFDFERVLECVRESELEYKLANQPNKFVNLIEELPDLELSLFTLNSSEVDS